MKVVDCSNLYLPFHCKKLGYYPSRWANCITCTDDHGKPLAGVVYDGYNGRTVNAHIWVEGRPSKEWYAAIFDYPFNRLMVEKIVGQVNGSNEEAQRLDEHFGFVEEARVSGYSDEGDLIMYTMTPDQCRVLTSSLWIKTLRIVEAA